MDLDTNSSSHVLTDIQTDYRTDKRELFMDHPSKNEGVSIYRLLHDHLQEKRKKVLINSARSFFIYYLVPKIASTKGGPKHICCRIITYAFEKNKSAHIGHILLIKI